MDAATMDAEPASIGVLLVHGIGRQKRFEHLNGQGRQIIRAIIARHGAENVTVEIERGPAAALHAEQDTWATGKGAPVRVLVRNAGKVTHRLHFHEMWWADVNETPSIAKQIRFWLWGLSVWAYPNPPVAKPGASRARGKLQGTEYVASPQDSGGEPNGSTRRNGRIKLFAAGVFFAISLPSGILLASAQRLFSWRAPDLLGILADYLSGVKIFNQRSRFGAPLGFGNDDFLDTLDEPPRVSVRRRMIRMIALMAEAEYGRWYVVAHSQGTVAALNGLMETPYAWPGYFDQHIWNEFCTKSASRPAFGGRACFPVDVGRTMPRRPVWAAPDTVAYREKIFKRFGGLLTLGSPLQKFAAIWPARVPINRMEVFPDAAEWINVFDPLDPVSGNMSSYRQQSRRQCPIPLEVGYASYPVLLQAHLEYLRWTGEGCLADGVAQWLMGNPSDAIAFGPRRYRHGDWRCFRRRAAAWAWWLVAFLLLAILAGWSVRVLAGELQGGLFGYLKALWDKRTAILGLYAIVAAVASTLFVGALCYVSIFDARNDPEVPSTNLEALPLP